jgi:hypothetical protein
MAQLTPVTTTEIEEINHQLHLNVFLFKETGECHSYDNPRNK